MNDKERQRHFAYEALVLLGVLALLAFICRLWPILLLILLGIFVATLRLLFLSSKKTEVVEPLPLLPVASKEPTEKDVRDMAYTVIMRKVSELVQIDHPGARWVWATPQARSHIETGEDVYIILNRAGGYRRARVHIQNLQVLGLEYESAPPVSQTETVLTAEPASEPETEPMPEDYSLLAFEWVEAHIMELNDRCNDAIGRGDTEIILSADELPTRESWPDIRRELAREDLSDVEIISDGIKINLTE